MPSERRATTIAVGGGKGGVGKSVIAANLAVAFARFGMRTVLVDADLGAANQHTLFGLDRPGLGLYGLLDREVESLEEATLETPEPRLRLLPSSTGRIGAANIGSAQKEKLLRHVAQLEAEIVVIDVGAGVAWNTIDFFLASDLRVAVTTPQLPAIQNLYCFLKAAVHRELRGAPQNQNERNATVGANEGRDAARVSDLVRYVEAESPELAKRMRALCGAFGATLVGNFVEAGTSERKGGGAVHALSRMLKDFLGVEAPVRALLPLDRSVHASVTKRIPLALSRPDHEVVEAISGLAEQLLSVDVARLRDERSGDAARAASDPPTRVKSDPAELAQGDAIARYGRREARLPVEWEARVVAMGKTMRAVIRDVSAHGMAIEGLHDTIPQGARAIVEIEGHPTRFDAIVRHAVCRGEHEFACGLELQESGVTAMRALIDFREVRAVGLGGAA